jgi:hypothetical protein
VSAWNCLQAWDKDDETCQTSSSTVSIPQPLKPVTVTLPLSLLENLEEKQRGAGRKTEIKSGKRRHFLLKTIKAIEGKETNSLALCLVPKLNHHFAQ